MKYLCTMLCLALLGSTAGDEAGGGSACGVQLEANQTSSDVPDILVDRMILCVADVQTSLSDGIRSANTLQEYRNSFRTACENLPMITNCTRDVVLHAGKCLNATLAATFEVMRQDFHTFLLVACANGGQKMAEVVAEIRLLKNMSDTPSFLEECIQEGNRHIEGLDTFEASAVSVAYYKTFRTIKDCMGRYEAGHANLIVLVNSILNDILKQLKCIHPEDQSELLCEALIQ